MMYGGRESFYDGTMLGAVMRHLRDTLRKRGELIPLGYNWPFVIAIDVTLVTTVVIATLQRPAADLLVGLLGVTVALFPFALFFVFGVKWVADVVGIAWTASAAILLFATATPVPTDFAPLILALMIGEVG